MNKKNNWKKTAAIMLGLALTVGATGCEFVVTNNEADLAQTIATVDITKELKKTDSPYKDVADDISAILEKLPSNISKRDLVAYFLSVGYQYVESYGYTYEATFNMLLDGLVSREIMIQYAVAYYLKQGAEDGSVTKAECEEYIANEIKGKEGREKELLEAHPEVLTLKYFLTDGGNGAAEATEEYNPLEDYERTVYTLKKSLNDSLDSMETSYVKAEEESTSETTEETRTLPTGADTEKEEYYPTDYEVYTGRNTLDSCGEYEKIEGSTTATRQKAYNAFLANLQGYSLIQSEGDKIEDTRDVTLLDYYYVELSSSLGQALINKYFEDIEESVIDAIDEEYVSKKYSELLEQQELAYANSSDSFSTALDGASADSSILYGLKDFGFVYNILLPFSTSQTEAYTRAQNDGLTTDQLYNVRKEILKGVKGEDLRGTWINKEDSANYSTKVGDEYYFFKENLENTDKYTELTHYLSLLPYNGTVTEEDDEYVTKPNKVTLTDVIGILEDTIATATGLTVTGAEVDTYEENVATTKYYDEETEETDYSKFVYYKGQVNFTEEVDPADYFDKTSAVYKMVAAANEVMFAYSTDPGCLNSYMGYAISPYTTSFMKEFEYAAQQAVKDGVGAYYVAPTDYGWHIIITTFAYTADGEVYGGYNHAEAVGDDMVEGSFSNLFFESIKASAASNYSTEVQNSVLNEYDNSACVKRYKDRYKDLLELDA